MTTTQKTPLVTPEIISQIMEYAEMIDLLGWGTITIRIDNHRVKSVSPEASIPPRVAGKKGPTEVVLIFRS